MTTTFHSTRSTTDSLTAKQAIRKGIADDGGLFVSDALGKTKVDVASLPGKSYQQIAAEVLGALLPDFTAEELGQCIADAYGEQWSDERITPLKPLGDDYVLELFNGPTSAFKDVALQILPRFMAHTTPADGDADEKIMILTATSGDTGKAALAGFADAPGTAITVFYPEGKVSQVQELQMTTQAGSNVQVAAVEGNFDDAQSAVKRIFGDRALAERLAGNSHVVLSSANSINIGRLAPQIIYYWYAWATLCRAGKINPTEPVNFSVPTGNFGDILAGYFAKCMGLPVGKLLCASNANNVLTEFLTTGRYDRRRPFYKTSSPSMDILVSSNLERLLYLASGGDAKMVAEKMQELDGQGWYQIGDTLLKKIQKVFLCGCCDDTMTSETIKTVWERDKYLLDPHTAVAWAVAEQHKAVLCGQTVVLSTASPYKFAPAVLAALGQKVPNDAFAEMAELQTLTGVPVPTPLAELETLSVLHHDCIEVNEMADYVRRKMGD